MHKTPSARRADRRDLLMVGTNDWTRMSAPSKTADRLRRVFRGAALWCPRIGTDLPALCWPDCMSNNRGSGELAIALIGRCRRCGARWPWRDCGPDDLAGAGRADSLGKSRRWTRCVHGAIAEGNSVATFAIARRRSRPMPGLFAGGVLLAMTDESWPAVCNGFPRQQLTPVNRRSCRGSVPDVRTGR